MFGTLFRIVLVIIVVAALGAFFLGYRIADRDDAYEREPVAGTGGAVSPAPPDDRVDVPEPAADGAESVDRARAAGARIGESLAVGAERAQRAAMDAALTAKIKSKMALDDVVKAAAIDVDTNDGVVTLTGAVASETVRERAVRLARETEGVSTVRDRLTAGS